MKTKTLLLGSSLLLSLLSLQAGAQIQIDVSEFPVQLTDHLAQEYWCNNDQDYGMPQPGADQVWDYQGFVQGLNSSFAYLTTTDPFFSSTYHFEAGEVALSTFVIPTDQHYGFDSFGYYEYAKEQHDEVIDISAITGTAGDEVHFVAAKEIYNGQINEVILPLNYGDFWSDVVNRSTPFEMTVSAFGLNNTPGEHRREMFVSHEVTGYGKLLMTDSLGATSDSMDVLLVDVYGLFVDSFFVGGGPAPDQLLQAMGLTQGMVTELYSSFFYRENYGSYIIEFQSNDPTPGSPTTKLFYNRDAVMVAPTVGLNEQAMVSVEAYPNPTQSGEMLNVSHPSITAQTAIQVFAIDGREIDGSTIVGASKGSLSLRLPSEMEAGSYFIRVIDPTGNTFVSQSLVITE